MMGGRKKPMKSLELSISIEINSSLEARVDGMPVPVVAAGKRITGHVVVRNANTQFTQGSIVHRVDILRQRVRKDEEEPVDEWRSAHGSNTVVLPRGDHAIKGDHRFPFDVDPHFNAPSYQGSALALVHSLEVHMLELNLELGGHRDVTAEQSFVVQAPVGTATTERAMVSVGDFGGSCRLELGGGALLPLGGSCEARIVARAIKEPLAKVLVKLLVVEGEEATPRCVREIVAWSRGWGGDEAPPSEGLTVQLRAADDAQLACDEEEGEHEALGPSIAEATDDAVLHPPFGPITYWLRLVLVPASGADEAWSTLPVTVAPRGGLAGAARGSLRPSDGRDAKKQDASAAASGGLLSLSPFTLFSLLLLALALWVVRRMPSHM